jgi:hypothetical protein
MRRFLFVSCLTFFAVSPASADVTHKIQSSIQLTVDGAASQATKIGSSYSVSGSGITLDTVGGLGTLTTGSAVGYTPAAYSLTNDGASFSYSETYIEGDDAQSATTVTSGVVTALPAFGNVTTQSGGVAGDLAGTITGAGVLDLTPGGAGTNATGQVILSITAN